MNELNYMSSVITIVGIFVVLLSIIIFKKKSELAINFIMRGILGMISIYLINELLLWMEISISVGLNITTFLTSGFLGFPGLLLLFGIKLYGLL
ncbi:MAG: pro-sigmaK processing inhibitor BofA family protein [Lachnospiraceae bacterium]